MCPDHSFLADARRAISSGSVTPPSASIPTRMNSRRQSGPVHNGICMKAFTCTRKLLNDTGRAARATNDKYFRALRRSCDQAINRIWYAATNRPQPSIIPATNIRRQLLLAGALIDSRSGFIGYSCLSMCPRIQCPTD